MSNDVGDEVKDLKVRFEHWRLMNKRAFQKIELQQMEALIAIYKREISESLPEPFQTIDEEKDYVITKFNYKVAARNVTLEYFEPKYWEAMMNDNYGPFRLDTEQIIKKSCAYQKAKAARHMGGGFITSPEILFCEELKMWATSTLSLIDADENAKILIKKRIRYLEEVMSADNLFEPLLTVKDTIQQLIVAVRQILKYHVIPFIDKELTHHDARKALNSLKNNVTVLLRNSIEYLYHVFNKTTGPQVDIGIAGIEGLIKIEANDKYTELIKLLVQSPEILNVFWPNEQLREKMFDSYGKISITSTPTQFLTVELNGFISVSNKFLTKKKEKTNIESDSYNLVIVNENDLKNIFVGDISGFEEGFRGSSQCASSFLCTIGLTMQLGRLYSILDKASHCASQGGTLLVYGIANAQFNTMLTTCEDLLGALRHYITNLFVLAEGRFEELVFMNKATPEKNTWIPHFKNLPSTFDKIDKVINVISSEVMSIKTQANSLTLYEQFQKAREDTTEFLNVAENFSKNMATILGTQYTKPPVHNIVKLPDLTTISSLMGKEELDESELMEAGDNRNVKLRDSKDSSRVIVDLSRNLTRLHNDTLKDSFNNSKSFDLDDSAFDVRNKTKRGGSDLHGTSPVPHWYFKENGKWNPYSNEISELIEKTLNQMGDNPKECTIGEIKIDFSKRMEVNPRIFNPNKKIRRGTWFWCDDDGSWVPYNESVSNKLEMKALGYREFKVTISEDSQKKRIVIGNDGKYKQFRKSPNAKPEGRDVQRGKNGNMIKS